MTDDSAPFKIIFFGTSSFAIPSLRSLLTDQRFEVVGVVTQPDRPVGRHAELTPPDIKRFLIEQHASIEIHQPEKLKEEAFKSWIESVGRECDAFVVVSYGKILPPWLLDLPKRGIVNVHGSLLPRWRGAAPIQAAIASGDSMSGVTVMLIDADLDHGPILGQAEEPITATDTGASLHDRLADLGGTILVPTLVEYLEGRIIPKEQNHAKATTCRTLTREDGKLDVSKTAEELERMIRAYDPWPGTWTEWNGKRLKIFSVSISNKTEETSGTIFLKDGKTLLACGEGTALELTRVQPEGKKEMRGEEFSNGLRG